MSESTKTALDEIKEIEAQTRKVTLIEVISELKDKAREIKRLKFYTETVLREMGYDDKEIKSVIDYLNNQVSLDEKIITEEVRKELNGKKDKAIKKVINLPLSAQVTQASTGWNYLAKWASDGLQATNSTAYVNSLQPSLTASDLEFVSWMK